VESGVETLQSGGDTDQSHKFFGGIYHPWRRFFARLIDMAILGDFIIPLLVFCLIFLSAHTAGTIAKALENPITLGFVVLGLLILIEPVLLSTWGNTPGKWLFGISLRTTDGDKLSFGEALRRSINVVIRGFAFGIPIVSLITLYLASRRLTKTGATSWDRTSQCVVTHKTWGTARTIVCALVVILFLLYYAADRAAP
jgi:uncharacterized RDD family membrane protein YckC